MKFTTNVQGLKLTIQPTNGIWGLFIIDYDGTEDLYETNKDINVIVANVADHAPNCCDDFDDLEDPELPQSLSDWQKII